VDRANFRPDRIEEAQDMASGFSGDAVRQINRLFRDGTAAGLTDGQLIERFTTRRAEVAETAFEALVIRHGPMVLRVVKRVLRDPHDVEDAFQATFLVLVKKAHAIGERELLGPWLYGVAHRVALKARGVAAKRNKREGGVIDDPPAELTEAPWLDLRPILHEELNRLPDKYKKPVILCHLQGLTHAEAAQELAWPVGTVSVRLTRARKLLKDRLTRRGLTTTAPLWAAEGASAAVPQTLINSTTKAALQAITGKLLVAGGISAGAITLSKRTLTMMLMSRLKWVTLPLALAIGAAGGAVVNQQIMIRSVVETRALATRTAAEKVPEPANPPVAPRPRPPRVPKPPTPVSPFSDEGEPKQVPGEMPEDPPIEDVGPGFPAATESPRELEFVPPPGYFDLPAPHKNDGTDPPLLKPGQILQVELLEALPARPISGDRVVRPDGTISLGFYGDLPVAGLNRHQIKVKLIEHLRRFIKDEFLGIMVIDNNDKLRYIPPVESTRVFVDDSINYQPGGPEHATRPQVSEGLPDSPASNARVYELEKKLDYVLQELKELRAGKAPADPSGSPINIDSNPPASAESKPGAPEAPKPVEPPPPVLPPSPPTVKPSGSG
jgi:RNA polymerase sigma factor (sigma-70 family)